MFTAVIPSDLSAEALAKEEVEESRGLGHFCGILRLRFAVLRMTRGVNPRMSVDLAHKNA